MAMFDNNQGNALFSSLWNNDIKYIAGGDHGNWFTPATHTPLPSSGFKIYGGASADFVYYSSIEAASMGNRFVTFFGREGNDTMMASQGRDIFNGGSGIDTMYYNHSANAVYVNLQTQTTSGTGGDVLIDVENVGGSNYSDTIIGNYSANTLRGASGNDTVDGSYGNDLIFGDDGNDHLKGGANNDTLLGGNGADTLEGNFGNDVLYGGGGSDKFVFSFPATTSLNPGRNRIEDFQDGIDRLDFSYPDFVANVGDLSISTRGNDTVIMTSGGNPQSFELVIANTAGLIDASDFIF